MEPQQPGSRSRSGTPFVRTFVQTLTYGNATITAEPVAPGAHPGSGERGAASRAKALIMDVHTRTFLVEA